MRRGNGRPILLGNMVVDAERCDAWVDDRPAGLTFIELELLLKMAQRPGRLAPREELSSILTHDPAAEHSAPLNVHISRLRKKLHGSNPWVIKTVWKRGYMLFDQQLAKQVERSRGDRFRARVRNASGGMLGSV